MTKVMRRILNLVAWIWTSWSDWILRNFFFLREEVKFTNMPCSQGQTPTVGRFLEVQI